MKNPFKSDNAPVIPNMLQYLSRSLSVPGARESDQGYNSYVGSCSVHGTLKRHISSGGDTTFEVANYDDDTTFVVTIINIDDKS